MRYAELCEQDEPPVPDLPGRVRRLLDRPIEFGLKDGRPAVMTVEGVPGYGLSLVVRVAGQFAGSMSIAPNRIPPPGDSDLYAEDRGSWSVTNLLVDPDFRRKGIASKMYDTLARAGMKILRSGIYGGTLKPDGAELWQSNRPSVRLGKPMPKVSRFWKPKQR